MQSVKRVKTTDDNPRTLVTPADEDDRFNLRFGGIMDEDIREIAPLPVKPSQVKVRIIVLH